jgi:hypothetical protein
MLVQQAASGFYAREKLFCQGVRIAAVIAAAFPREKARELG